jgi:hypothetical protein
MISASSQSGHGEVVGNHPERLFGQVVTPSLFKTLNVQPMLGRVFREDEAPIGMPASVIVLSHDLWQRRFGGEPDILGKQIRLNGRKRTVIGVMPAGFWYPDETSEYWIPLAFTSFQLEGSDRLFTVTARLKAGTTIGQAQADVEGISGQLGRDFPDRYKGWSVWVVPLREFWFDNRNFFIASKLAGTCKRNDDSLSQCRVGAAMRMLMALQQSF